MATQLRTRNRSGVTGSIRKLKVSDLATNKHSQCSWNQNLQRPIQLQPTMLKSRVKKKKSNTRQGNQTLVQLWNCSNLQLSHQNLIPKLTMEENSNVVRTMEKNAKALLGKQIWRLITNPNNLVSKVLKAKYHHSESIFRCWIPKNASWIWKSVMGVRESVEEGISRWIGNRRSTRIWENRWIPANPHGKPVRRRPLNSNLTKVEELISDFRWNRPLIFKTICKSDAENKLKIPALQEEKTVTWVNTL